MTQRLHLLVTAAYDRERADKGITELLQVAGHTVARTEVQRWLLAGQIQRSGELLERRTPLRTGDRIDVEVGRPQTSDATPDASVSFQVVFEDPHLLVVDKPAGLVVHPARGHRTGTLVNGLLAHGGFELASSDARDPEGHLRPGIVHRLDKDTSGLLVVAKDARTREGLKKLFAAHDIERTYLALTVGLTEKRTWDTTHGRHPTNRLRFSSKLDAHRPGVRRATTHIEPLQVLLGGVGTFVRCTLETGRTHQIRVHLAEQSKTPILADSLYGTKPTDPLLLDVMKALGRQALHAAVLGFVHPITLEKLRWESPLPPDMQAALTALGGGASS